jgi:hypothetical protein
MRKTAMAIEKRHDPHPVTFTLIDGAFTRSSSRNWGGMH